MRLSAAMKSIDPAIIKMMMTIFCVRVSMRQGSPDGDLKLIEDLPD
jgi:hypothetical protein